MDREIREPLLQESFGIEEMTTSSDWPAAAAQRAKLYIPPEWPGEHDSDATCVVSYDSTKKIIYIKDGQGRVLDAMDTRDIIGADLEIKLFGPTEALTHVGFRNAKARSEVSAVEDDIVATASSSSVPKKDSACNIFKPLEHNADKIFSLHDFGADKISLDTQAMAILNIYAYPRKHPSQTTWGNWFGLTEFKPMPNPNPPEPVSHKMGNRYAHHRHFEVVRSEDFADIRSLVRAIRSVTSLQIPPTKYLVFLNPVGGQKKAREIYDSVVAPMLDQASVDHDLVVTTRARHAEEYAMEADFDAYDGFFVMGGDGIIHEVLQGIRKRADANQLLKKLKMGAIGCGTSNGLAASILHESEVRRNTLQNNTFFTFV
jgi:sphingosine kinase